MFKKICLLFILLVVITSGCNKNESKSDLYSSILKKGHLTVGISYDAKPFSFKDSDGKIKGVDADIAREIARRILGSEQKVVFTHIAPQNRSKAVSNGDVDMVISSMTITPDRKKIVEFSDPYFVAGQAICVKKDSNIDSYDDLNNKNVVVVLGTTGETNLRDFAPNAIIQGYVDNADAFNAFRKGGYDAVTTDDSLLLGFVMDNQDYKILPGRLTTEPYGIALKKSKDTMTFKKALNDIISKIKFDGTLQTIKDKWNVT